MRSREAHHAFHQQFRNEHVSNRLWLLLGFFPLPNQVPDCVVIHLHVASVTEVHIGERISWFHSRF